jgi:peptide/nickel transport system permease protein
MRLIGRILARVLAAGVMLLVVSALLFAMTDLLPGDVASRILGRSPDPEQLAILRERLGLDLPLAERYLTWLGRLPTGDAGVSLVSGQPVTEIVGQRLWNSSLLAAVAFLLYVPIAVLPAAVQAMRADRPLDQAISSVSLGLLSIPDFLLGTVLLLLFAWALPLLPVRSTIDGAMSGTEVLEALVLPAVTIALVMGTYAMRYLRDSLIEVLGSDHIRMARLNGLSEARILWRHALPNALVPFLNITSLNLTYLFGGVVVVEQVFAFPGFGALLVGALMQLDIPLVQATVLIAAAVYIGGNLLADLLALLFNPRLRDAL